MSVMKKTWGELITYLDVYRILTEVASMVGRCTNLDELYEDKYSEYTYLEEVSTYMLQLLSTVENNNSWYNMPIYMSSYKEKDKRIVYLIVDKLSRYLSFYEKMLNDEGLQRKLTTTKNYQHNNKSLSSDKNLYSETPQIELDNFEDAINFASNLSKSDLKTKSKQTGNSGETVKSTSWDESLKNLRFVFYTDLAEFISSIPNMIYTYYSLDSMPALELLKEQQNYLKTIIKL